MSAKTSVYDTWKMLERIDQQASNATEVDTRLEALVTEQQAIIDQYNQDDEAMETEESTAADMGFTLQLSLLQTVLNLVRKAQKGDV